MKKEFVIATVAMSLGIVAPLSQVVTSTPVSAKTTSHSYVTTTNKSVSVTNIRKGSIVTLLNAKNKAIVSVKAQRAGTITFNLNNIQVNQLTSTNTLAVKLNSGYKYNINFYFNKQINNNNNNTNKKTPTIKHSYVTTTSNSISVTNIRKGSTVELKNNLGQAIATKTAINAGTVTFNLNTQQVNQLTKTDILAIKLSSGYKFNINFNFINYSAPTNNKFINGIPTELQGNWQAKLGYMTGNWNMTSRSSVLTVNDPETLNNVQYKYLGNHTYVLKGIENYYSNGTTVQYTVKKVSANHLTLTTANGVSQWYK